MCGIINAVAEAVYAGTKIKDLATRQTLVERDVRDGASGSGTVDRSPVLLADGRVDAGARFVRTTNATRCNEAAQLP